MVARKLFLRCNRSRGIPAAENIAKEGDAPNTNGRIYDDACNYLLGWATVFLKDPGKESGKLCAINKTGRCVWEWHVIYTIKFIKY